MIRKSGWLIMLVVLALVFAFVYLFAGFAIRLSMVYALEKTFGAEVNIGDVSVGLAPLTLEVDELAITDKNSPMQNLFSFTRANAAFSVWPALLGYYVIDELAVDGFEYGSARERPGKVYRGAHADAEESFDLTDTLKLDLPDADELLKRIDLQTEVKGKALAEQAVSQREKLEQLARQLPDQTTLDRLEAEIEALTSSKVENPADLAAKAEQLKQLKASVRQEHQRLLEVKQGLAESRQDLDAAVAQLRQARQEDWRKIQDLANLEGGGLAGITQILLGDYWGERVAQLQALYQFAKPYLPADADTEGGEERPVLPNRILPLPRQPYPGLWIKTARVNWRMAGGEATVSLQDVTREHELIGKPTLLNLNVEQMPRLDSFELHGEFAVRAVMTTQLSWTLRGYDVNGVTLGGNDTALTLTDAKVNSTGSLQLVDRELTQGAQVSLQEPSFSATGGGIMQRLAEVLNDQAQIPMSLNAQGQVSDPDVSIRSPLDQIIGDAILGEARQKARQWQQEMQTRLDTTLQRELDASQPWLASLDTKDASVVAMEDQITELMATKLNDLKSDVSERVKDSLKDSLNDKLLNRGE